MIEAGKQEYKCVDSIGRPASVRRCVGDGVGQIIVQKNCMRVPRSSTSSGVYVGLEVLQADLWRMRPEVDVDGMVLQVSQAAPEIGWRRKITRYGYRIMRWFVSITSESCRRWLEVWADFHCEDSRRRSIAEVDPLFTETLSVQNARGHPYHDDLLVLGLKPKAVAWLKVTISPSTVQEVGKKHKRVVKESGPKRKFRC